MFLIGCLSLGFCTVYAQDDLEEINFPLNSSVVVDGFQGLDLLAAVMARHSNLDLEVVGHTDSIGTAEYNKKLSQKRAESVKAYLVSKGAAAGKVATSGEGIDRSFDNSEREGRFRNRRVDLYLYETVDGNRAKVAYERLLALFFGDQGGMRLEALQELENKASKGNETVLAKLSELEKQVNAMNDALQRRIGNLERSQAELAKRTEELPKSAAMNFNMGNYTGVSIAAGTDDDGEFVGRIEGMYFRPVNDHFAIQFQGDANYYDGREEGQADVAAVYQKGGFKMAAAGSYKWASIDLFETARIAQGAILADFRFGSGKFGLFGTFPIADGDVVNTINSGIYTIEQYVSVPTQLGLDFGVSFGDKIDLHGYASSLDTEQSDADFSAGIGLDFLIKERLSFFLEAEMNNGLLHPTDDLMRYMVGLKLGSWSHARYNVSDQITPVNIPEVRYEILTRTMRTGNSAPIADAGESRTNVAAGEVSLDGSGSSDPEGDGLTYRWSQTSGPGVEITGADQAMASFVGVAGANYSFRLTVRDDRGASSDDIVSILMEAAPPPPIPDAAIVSFLATPGTIDLGQFANLSWTTTDAVMVTLSGIGEVPASGTLLVAPEVTTEYTLTATGEEGDTVSQSVTVTVIQPPPPPDPEPAVVNFFTASPAEITEGEFTTLSWGTEYAETVTISGIGEVSPSGSLILNLTETTTYTLTATNDEGSDSAEVTVVVNPIIPPPPENNPPVADAGVDVREALPGILTLDGSRSFDPDGDPLTYEWIQLSGPPATLVGADTVTPTFQAIPGRYLFRLTVRDGRGGFDMDDVEAQVVDFKR
jgi:hypothetical protein